MASKADQSRDNPSQVELEIEPRFCLGKLASMSFID